MSVLSSLKNVAFHLAERTPLLLRPRDAERKLRSFDALMEEQLKTPPNLWQVQLGVLRMLHRVLFRSETIGNCDDHPVRDTWRARLLHKRPLRLPVLVALRAVAPLDFSGLLSPTWRVQRHLLAAHHDGLQFVYDFELLAMSPGALDKVRADAEAIVNGRNPRASAWRDVAIFERYHENLIEALDAFASGELQMGVDADNPDLTFFGFLRWCSQQPQSAEETWALYDAGEYSIADGIQRSPVQPSSPSFSAIGV